MGRYERAVEHAFMAGESTLAPLPTQKRETPFTARGSGLKEFQIDAQTLTDEGVETDDDAVRRVQNGFPQNDVSALGVTEAGRTAANVESYAGTKRIRPVSSPSRGLDELKITEGELALVEKKSAAEKRVAKLPPSEGVEQWRTSPQLDKVTTSRGQEERRIEEESRARDIKQRKQSLFFLREELKRDEAAYTRQQEEILKLQADIEGEQNPEVKAAKLKVLGRFLKEQNFLYDIIQILKKNKQLQSKNLTV